MTQNKYTYGYIWKIAYPILISLIMEQLIGMTDTVFLGRVGELELGASAIASIYYLIIFMLGFGFSIGAQILIARRNGEGRYSEIGNIFYHGIYFLIFAALVICLISIMLSSKILNSVVASQAIGDKAVSYINWRIFGLFFSFTGAMFRAFFVGTTQTKTLTMNSIIMVISNIIFNYILIFGKLGFPALGIAGAAIGSTLAELVSCIFFIIYTVRKVDYKKYGLNRIGRFKKESLGNIMNLSVWTMIQNFLSIATWFLFFLYIEHLGERQLAITNIIRSISSITFMTIVAFSSTCSSIISNMIGSGHSELVGDTIKKHIIMTYCILTPILILFCIFPQNTISIFTDINDLQLASIPSLWVLCSSYIFMIPANIYFQSVSGTGNTRMAFKLEMISLFIYTAFITYVILIHKADVAICWFSEHVYAISMLIMCYTYMKKGKWNKIKI